MVQVPRVGRYVEQTMKQTQLRAQTATQARTQRQRQTELTFVAGFKKTRVFFKKAQPSGFFGQAGKNR